MNAVTEEKSRLGELFSAIDSKNTEAFLGFLTEDATFRFGSASEICGQAAIRDGVNSFFDSIAGSQHQIDQVIIDGNTLVCEGFVLYQRHDEREITVPFVDIFEYTGDLISAYKIYIDISAVFAD